jgi:hypothetical protein
VVVIKLREGMGNQMFQYAMGRYLSLTHGLELKLDIRSYSNNSLRKYELAQFNIDPFPILVPVVMRESLVCDAMAEPGVDGIEQEPTI